MKKLILFILTSLLILTFSSCAEPPTEEEAKSIAEALIKSSYELNRIYYGEGLPHVEPEANSIYADVTDDAAYLTEDELREATLAVYTELYADSIFRMYLSGYSDEDTGSVIYPRYVESEDRLTVNLNIEPLISGERTYDFGSAVIKKCKAKMIVIEYDTYVDGEPDIKVEVTLRPQKIERDDYTVTEWRIDSPTY